jgi:Ni,Fe-hydrogenase I cytochrome b subunit
MIQFFRGLKEFALFLMFLVILFLIATPMALYIETGNGLYTLLYTPLVVYGIYMMGERE